MVKTISKLRILSFLFFGVVFFSQGRLHPLSDEFDAVGEIDFENYFQMGNDYYQKQDYLSALKIYEKLIIDYENQRIQEEGESGKIKTSPSEMATLYYNQGNTLYKLYERGYSTNQYLAKSVWSFHQALLHQPNHENARYNLQVIRNQLNPEQTASLNLMERIHLFYLEIKNWLVHFWGISFILMITVLIVRKREKVQNYLSSRKKMDQLIKAVGVAVILLYSLLLMFIVINSLYSPENRLGIISQDSEVKAEPNQNQEVQTLFGLREGSEVLINRASPNGRWVEVEFNFQRGWLPTHQVWEIE